jgi:hypothetical protein
MSSDDANSRKRKPTSEKPETVSSNDDRNQNEESNTARRLSTNGSASTAVSLQVDTPVVAENAAAPETAYVEHEESIQSIWKMIQDLVCSNNAKVNAALDALMGLDLEIQVVGGCFTLVQLMKNCLDEEAIARIPAYGIQPTMAK